jgi:catechol 2,3-dioxygenase-like lactoylglutathione lyase family enzyme
VPTRLIVRDVAQAVAFYCDQLGFTVIDDYGAAFASVGLGNTELWLSGPASSAAKAMPDGSKPEPGGWNRPVIEVDDIEAVAEKLRRAGAVFRNEPLTGPGGTQVLVEDPSGNPVEVFQPR